MTKYTIASVFVLLFSFGVLAQKKDTKTIEYSLLTNDLPITYFGGGLNFDASLNNYNMTLFGIGPNIKYINEKIAIDASARFHLLEKTADYAGRQPEAISIYEEENSKDFTIDFSYFFKSDIATEGIPVSLGQKRNTRFYTIINAKTETRYGINLGLHSGFTYYNFQNDDFDKAPGASVDGLITSTYHQFSVLKIGGNRTKFENLKIKTDKFGEVTLTGSTKLYFNVLFLMSSQLDDVFVEQIVTGQPGAFYSQRALDGMDRRRLGFSVGYEVFNMNDFVIDDKNRDVGFVIEAGSQPGPAAGFGNNLYIDLKVKLNFGKIL